MLPCLVLSAPSMSMESTYSVEVLEKGDPVEDLRGSCRDVTPLLRGLPPLDVNNPVDRRHARPTKVCCSPREEQPVVGAGPLVHQWQ